MFAIDLGNNELLVLNILCIYQYYGQTFQDASESTPDPSRVLMFCDWFKFDAWRRRRRRRREEEEEEEEEEKSFSFCR